jgi:hypothetical protein
LGLSSAKLWQANNAAERIPLLSRRAEPRDNGRSVPLSGFSMLATLALSLLASIWPFHGKPQVTTQRYAEPLWKVAISRDRFTKGASCVVYQGTRSHPLVSATRTAVRFHFPRRDDVSQAWYAFDGGPAKPWKLDAPTLVTLGVSLDGQDIRNPSGGVLVLPIAEVKGAHIVSIRLDDKHGPHRFGLDGMNDALASAEAQGCARIVAP